MTFINLSVVCGADFGSNRRSKSAFPPFFLLVWGQKSCFPFGEWLRLSPTGDLKRNVPRVRPVHTLTGSALTAHLSPWERRSREAQEAVESFLGLRGSRRPATFSASSGFQLARRMAGWDGSRPSIPCRALHHWLGLRPPRASPDSRLAPLS